MIEKKKRVVITGMGIISPIGNNLQEFWENLKNGKSGVAPITRIKKDTHITKYAAEVKNFDTIHNLSIKEQRRLDLFSQYSLAASRQAIQHANITTTSVDPDRIGIVLGIGIGGFSTIEESYIKYLPSLTLAHESTDPKTVNISPFTIPKLIANIASSNIAIDMVFKGPCYALATACASGTDAIGNAMEHIRTDKADIIIAGGAEAPITHLAVAGFNALHALSTKFSDNPTIASRPFDKDRDGFVIGEGAGILVLESYEHAKGRNAPIIAEVLGAGMTCDAYHQTAPHPEGEGATRSMQLALSHSDIPPSDIDYINAHGTSTPLNDIVETKTIKTVFGAYAHKDLKISSSKSMTGHCIGAAGGIEAIVCALCIQNNFIPPTINLDNPDDQCDLNYIPNKGVHQNVQTTLSNTFGFGGHNGTLILRTPT